MNEETIIENKPLALKSGDAQPTVTNHQFGEKKEKKGNAWKYVTLSGTSGILMGAGLLYAGQITARQIDQTETLEEDSTTNYIADNGLHVAEVDQSLPFGEAFEAARAEVGPGGVFLWHGGLYNTYTDDEWNSMSIDEKNDFAQLISPEVSLEDIPTPTDDQPDIVIESSLGDDPNEGNVLSENLMVGETSVNEAADRDVRIVSREEVEAGFGNEDVHIVGYNEIEGHLAVGYDINDDGNADVAVIDVDDSHTLSDADIIVDREGNAATVADVRNASDQSEVPSEDSAYGQMASMENPEVAPDMPDYMNDVLVDA